MRLRWWGEGGGGGIWREGLLVRLTRQMEHWSFEHKRRWKWRRRWMQDGAWHRKIASSLQHNTCNFFHIWCYIWRRQSAPPPPPPLTTTTTTTATATIYSKYITRTQLVKDKYPLRGRRLERRKSRAVHACLVLLYLYFEQGTGSTNIKWKINNGTTTFFQK